MKTLAWLTVLACAMAQAATLPSATSADARIDRADIDRTTITGHQELPKVLYIVPWKQALPGSVDPRPRRSVLDEALAPIDRDVFRRQLRYRAQTETPSPQEKTP